MREFPSGTPKQLTRGEDSDVAPVWSPDGGTLAFERIGEDQVQYIVIPADGGAERKVAELAPGARSRPAQLRSVVDGRTADRW